MPELKALTSLTRAQLAAREAVLTEAVHTLVLQARLDGGVMPACLGAMKVHAYHLRQEMERRDRQAESGEPMPVEVALAAVSQTARQRDAADRVASRGE